MIAPLLLVLLAVTAPARSETPASGQYGPVLLAIRGNEVSGALSESRIGPGTEASPGFTCAFGFTGRLDGDRARIRSWTPGDAATIGGEMTLRGGLLTLRLDEDQAGCLMTVGGMTRAPFEARLRRPAEGWTGIRLVAARRAVLHAAPDPATATRAYVVAFDAVAVRAERPGWVAAEYPAGTRPVRGWLRAADLAPVTPPGP